MNSPPSTPFEPKNTSHARAARKAARPAARARGAPARGAGNCTALNGLYEGFRGPLCGRMAPAVAAVWALCLTLGLAWFPMFILTCRCVCVCACACVCVCVCVCSHA